MPIKTNDTNILKINVNANKKSVDELLDEGKSLREINEIIKPKFVEINIPNQYEYDWDTMVDLQREEWERLQNMKLELKVNEGVAQLCKGH